jgi:hypothetical protein
MAAPIMPIVANPPLRALLNASLVNLALPITDGMKQSVNECSAIVANSSLATDAERGEFIQFAHDILHASTNLHVPACTYMTQHN